MIPSTQLSTTPLALACARTQPAAEPGPASNVKFGSVLDRFEYGSQLPYTRNGLVASWKIKHAIFKEYNAIPEANAEERFDFLVNKALGSLDERTIAKALRTMPTLDVPLKRHLSLMADAVGTAGTTKIFKPAREYACAVAAHPDASDRLKQLIRLLLDSQTRTVQTSSTYLGTGNSGYIIGTKEVGNARLFIDTQKEIKAMGGATRQSAGSTSSTGADLEQAKAEFKEAFSKTRLGKMFGGGKG